MVTTRAVSEVQGELETGSFARYRTNPTGLSSIVVATFNIRYAVGPFLISGSLLRRAGFGFPQPRDAVVARNIKSAAGSLSSGKAMPPVDILALQEADKRTVRTGGHHIACELAKSMQMYFAHAPAGVPKDEDPKPREWYLNFEEPILASDPGDTGIALLSRWPFDVTRVELPWSRCAFRPRVAMAAQFLVNGKALHVLSIHVDPHASIEDQIEQHRALLACAEQHSEPVILMGDFNTLSKRSAVAIRASIEEQGYTTVIPTGIGTWRAGLIRLHADWIFTRGLRIVRWGVARSVRVSDHWPLWAEIDVTNL